MAREKPEGWRNKKPDDPRRHALAAKGIPTKRPGGRWRSKSIEVVDYLGHVEPEEDVEELPRDIGLMDWLEKYGISRRGEMTWVEKQYAREGKLSLEGYIIEVSREAGGGWGADLNLHGLPGSPTTGYSVIGDLTTPTLSEAKERLDAGARSFLAGRSLARAASEEHTELKRQHDMEVALALLAIDRPE